MSDWHSCLACEITAGHKSAPGGTIFEDEHWICDHEIYCQLEMWLILRPRRHFEHFADMRDEEDAKLGGHIKRLCRAMMQARPLRKVFVLSFGASVKHVHMYLIPVREDFPEHGREVLERIHSGVWAVTPECAARAADAVREQLGIMQSIPPPPRMPTNLKRDSAFAESTVELEPRRIIQTSLEIPHPVSANRPDRDPET